MERKNIYCLKFELPTIESGINSSQFFKSIEACLVGFENFNHAIVGGISKELRVVSYVEEIEQGSIKIWLRDVLKYKIKDDFIKDIISNPIASVLILIKKKSLNSLNENISQENKERQILIDIKEELQKLPNIPLFKPDINKEVLFDSINQIASSIENTKGVSFLDEKEKETKIIGKFAYVSDEKEIVVTEPQIIIGHIVVHSIVYDKKTKFWKFTYNGKNEIIDISICDIYDIIHDRGGALIGDTFKVKLEITEKRNKNVFKNYYKVIEVLEFIPSKKGYQREFSF